MTILLATAFALFAGLMMTRLFKYLHLNFPDVTAFLISGVLVGPVGESQALFHTLCGCAFRKNVYDDVKSISSILVSFELLHNEIYSSVLLERAAKTQVLFSRVWDFSQQARSR